MLAIPTILLSYLPLAFQPLAKPIVFTPLSWVRRTIKQMLLPVLLKDVQEYNSNTDNKDLLGPQEKGKVQFTGWLLSRYKNKAGQQVMGDLVQDYITLIFESTPSSAMALFFVVCELAADPALQDVLRQELKEKTQEGVLPETHLNELSKMDSVMRESARVNGFSHRKSKKPAIPPHITVLHLKNNSPKHGATQARSHAENSRVL